MLEFNNKKTRCFIAQSKNHKSNIWLNDGMKFQSLIGNAIFKEALYNVQKSKRVSMWIKANLKITNAIFFLKKNPIGI